MDPASEQASFSQPTQSAPIPPTPPGLPGPTTPARSPVAVVIGLLLVLPAFIALIVSYVVPTIWTITTSFQKRNPLQDSGEPVGADNYSAIAESLGSRIGYSLAFAAFPLLTFLIAAPLLAFAAHKSGLVGRWVVRIALAVPMVCIAPVAIAATFLLETATAGGRESPLTNINTAPFALLGWAWVGTFGLVCGVGVTLFLAALRRRDNQGSVWPGLIIVAGLGVIAAPALALQTFVFPYVITRGGPARSTMTSMLDMFEFGFQRLEFGVSAAHSTIVLVILGVLGLLAALLVILTGLRMEFDSVRRSADDPPGWPNGRVLAMVLGAILLVVVLWFTWNGLGPTLSRVISRSGGETIAITSSTRLAVNTWLPPLISSVTAVGLAALAGFAIGALRPLGRHSELLLLLFAPWLFVGIGPLAVAKWNTAQQTELVNTFVGLIPPVAIAIPALFVFTLLFKGQARRQQELVAGGVPVRESYMRTLLPTLPMIVLVGGFSWLFQAQDLTWPLLVASDRDYFNGSLTLLMALQQAATADAPVFLALPIAVVLIGAVVLAVAQVLYLDRLAIRAGRR
jgi:ABC-type sugar transport system permease subunit